MFRLTVKGMLDHKLRFVLTALSISLGVAFLAGTLVYAATIRRTFDDMFVDINRIDVLVRSTDNADTATGPQRTRIDQSLIDTIRRQPGVDAAEGSTIGYAQIVARNGKALGGFGPPTYGISWSVDPRLNSATLVEGHAPGTGEVVLDRGSKTNGGFALGDPVKIITRNGPQTFTLVGAIRYGTADSPAGATLAYFDFTTAQQLVGQPGKVDEIGVSATPGVSREDLRARVQAGLPPGTHLETITGDQLVTESQDAVAAGMSFFSTFLLIFAGIALFVATFIINNTFSILVAQRTRELALLRALGASRRQVTLSVLSESTLLGVIASVVGLVLGLGLAVGLKGLLDLIGFNLPTSGLAVPPSAIALAILVGIGVTLVASVIPARRASRVPPMAALQTIGVEPRSNRPARLVLGSVLLGAGLLTALVALRVAPNDALTPVALAAFAAFVGVLALAPAIARPVSTVLGVPFSRFRGEPGHLAQENATRNPRRTSATAAALMIGVALVGTITILASSTRASVAATIDTAMRADYLVVPAGGAGGFAAAGFSPDVRNQIAALPEVAVVSPFRIGAAKIDNNTAPSGVVAVEPATLPAVTDLGTITGDLTSLGDGAVAVSAQEATTHHWQLGDTISMSFTSAQSAPARVVAIYERRDTLGDYLIPLATAQQHFRDDLDSQLGIKLRAGVAPTTGRQAIERVTDSSANLQLMDMTDYKAKSSASVDQLLGLVYALLLLSVIIALIGIANTLALSIHERRHELGLLRAVGMTRRQLRASVRYESTIIALLGTALGLALAIGIGSAVTIALRPQGISTLVLPAGQLAMIAALATIAGIIAAIRPARSASRINVLQAVTTQ